MKTIQDIECEISKLEREKEQLIAIKRKDQYLAVLKSKKE